MKKRLWEFGIGLAAHYLRILALAPVAGAAIAALSLAGAVTKTQWLTSPVLEQVLPAPERSYEGGISGFGLPIVWEYAAILFWIPIVLAIVEQVTGKNLRCADLHFKWWCYGLGIYFAAFAIFTLIFMDMGGSRLGGSSIALVLFASLFAVAMAGVGGLRLIAFAENRLVELSGNTGNTAGGEKEAGEV